MIVKSSVKCYFIRFSTNLYYLAPFLFLPNFGVLFRLSKKVQNVYAWVGFFIKSKSDFLHRVFIHSLYHLKGIVALSSNKKYVLPVIIEKKILNGLNLGLL